MSAVSGVAPAVKRLSPFNAMERKRHEAVILFPAGHGKLTDTTTDTEGKGVRAAASGVSNELLFWLADAIW
jgi:hypothetical protein